MSLEVIVPVVAAIIGLAGGWLTTKIQHRGRPENAFIDQLQEEMQDLRKRMRRLEKRDRIYLPHILRQNGIIERLGGTPLPLPKVLQDYLDGTDEDDDTQ